MSDKDLVIPKNGEAAEENIDKEEVKSKKEPITREESERTEKVFFEDDETVRLRDGKTYRVPPLGLKESLRVMKLLGSINTTLIVTNLMPMEDLENGGLEDDSAVEDRYNKLMEVLHIAFAPYYEHVTVEYLEKYIDLVTAKRVIEILIGLNGLKKDM